MCEDFVYPGVKFHYTVTYTGTVKELSEQALKRHTIISFPLNNIDVDIITKLNVFDSIVAHILLYGSRIYVILTLKNRKIGYQICKYL